MKQMNIRINVLKINKVKQDTSIGMASLIGPIDNINTNYKRSISSYQILGVSSCNINDTYNNLTQTANFTIPIKDTILIRDHMINGTMIQGYLEFKNLERLYLGNQVIIDMGYNQHWQTRFIGYISKFVEEKDSIKIELEDSMYLLKRSKSMQKNFPKVITKDTFSIKDYIGKDFDLKHLLYWILQNLQYQREYSDKNVVVPKTRYYETVLGKVVMKDAITPAEIFKYYLKNVFNMKVFFRLEYILEENTKSNFNNMMEPILYVGWSNWDGNPYKEFLVGGNNIPMQSSSIGKTEYKQTKRIYDSTSKKPVTDFKYSRKYKFMYPYNQAFQESYNPIVENNLEWYNTDKYNLKITAKSFNSSEQKTNTVIYQFGEFSTSEKEAENKAKNKKKKDTTNAGATLIKDTNNLETFNEINLSYPNLNIEQLKDKCKEFYNNYPQSGLRGSFTALGEPFVRQGDIVQLKIDTSHIINTENILSKDYKKPSLNKQSNIRDDYITYYIKAVETTFSIDEGIKQHITIDKEVK